MPTIFIKCGNFSIISPSNTNTNTNLSPVGHHLLHINLELESSIKSSKHLAKATSPLQRSEHYLKTPHPTVADALQTTHRKMCVEKFGTCAKCNKESSFIGYCRLLPPTFAARQCKWFKKGKIVKAWVCPECKNGAPQGSDTLSQFEAQTFSEVVDVVNIAWGRLQKTEEEKPAKKVTKKASKTTGKTTNNATRKTATNVTCKTASNEVIS